MFHLLVIWILSSLSSSFRSSDSVYEVCAPKAGWSREENAIRPSDPDQAKRLNALDSYGDRKLGEFVYLL